MCLYYVVSITITSNSWHVNCVWCVTHGGRCCSEEWRRSGCEPERKGWASSASPRSGSPTGSDASCGLTQEGVVSIDTCGHTAGHSTKSQSKCSSNHLAVTSSNRVSDQSERLLLEVDILRPFVEWTLTATAWSGHVCELLIRILWLLYLFTHIHTLHLLITSL